MLVVTGVTSLLPVWSLGTKWRNQQAVPFHWSWLLYMQLSFQVSNSGVNHAIGLFFLCMFLLDICLLWISGLENHKIILYMWEFGLCNITYTLYSFLFCGASDFLWELTCGDRFNWINSFRITKFCRKTSQEFSNQYTDWI